MTDRGRYGAGSLRQRVPGAWELRVSAGRDTSTHRYLQRTATFRGTEKQARKALAAFVASVESGSGKGGDATVAELMDAWLEFDADKVSLNTLQGYRSKARHRIVPELGKVPLRKLSGPDLERWYRRLLKEEGLAPSHVRRLAWPTPTEAAAALL